MRVSFLALLVALAACSSSAAPPSTTSGANGQVFVVANQGGDLKGHTPRSFAGQSTGLFIGDNLNTRFPNGDGGRPTFDLPVTAAGATRALLASDALVTRGSPFVDLGPLVVELVTYEEFGRDLFDLPGRLGGSSV